MTQYRIYEQMTDGRCFVSYAYVDPMGTASYAWCGKAKAARLFDSAELAAATAKAIQKTIAATCGKTVELLIVPATGGANKSPRWTA